MTTMIYREGATKTSERFNLCPNPRYLGIDGKAGGGSASWPQEDVATGGPDGGGWTLITADAEQTGDVAVGTDEAATAVLGITAGTTYTGSVHMRADQSVAAFFVYIMWRDDTGAGVGTTDGETLPDPAVGEWHRLVVTGQAPAGATQAQVRARVTLGTDPMQAGESIGVGQRMIEEEVFATPYFDGDYPVDGRMTYDWFGDPNDSPSVERRVGSADLPELVLNYQHQTATGVTVHQTVSSGSPVITRKDIAWTLPSGTYQFFCSTEQLALDVAETCNGTTNVVLESSDVPQAPFTFCPTDQVTVTWNTPYSSWTVSVPYVRLT